MPNRHRSPTAAPPRVIERTLEEAARKSIQAGLDRLDATGQPLDAWQAVAVTMALTIYSMRMYPAVIPQMLRVFTPVGDRPKTFQPVALPERWVGELEMLRRENGFPRKV